MKKFLLLAIFICTIMNLFGQSAFVRRGSDDAYLLDRLDILSGRVSDTLFTATSPYTIKDKVNFLENYLVEHRKDLSKSDLVDIKRMISKNGEWASNGDAAEESQFSLFFTMYQTKSDFVHLNKKNYSLILNPVIYYQQRFESGNSKQNLFVNSRGLELRGSINKRLGFYTIFTDNQERGPLHHQNYVKNHSAVPGATYYKDFKIEKPGYAQDYLYAAGYIDADVIKNTVNVSFGHDRFQIGDGYRSLFLSDFGANYLFAKINTRLGRFNYQNLFMELTPQYLRGGDRLLPKKYAAMHHLSINLAKWLNVGIFESVVFSRKDHFEFQYMNPIILYRSIEQTTGSPDNALFGLNGKINTGIGAVLYGQILLDEFKFSELKARNGWWGNKYGIQMGVKATDIFHIKNLFLQAELNMVRPFTYTFRDSIGNYTHYNQNLAHPYGSNFMEINLIARYKPMKNLFLTLNATYNKQGRDTTGGAKTFGGNPFGLYTRRNANYGVSLYNGYPTEVFFTNLNASYELKDNFFIDFGVGYRSEKATHISNPTFSSTQAYLGFRLNAVRRQYDY